MRMSVVVGCITQVPGMDALVTCANEHLVGTQLPYINLDGSGGCVFDCTDSAVGRAAGPRLREACAQLPVIEEGDSDPRWGGIRCPVGEARVTPAFGLSEKCRFLVHIVGPAWPGGAEELRAAYHAAAVAALQGASEGAACEAKAALGAVAGSVVGGGATVTGSSLAVSMAVPAISSGIQQWPRDMSWAAGVQVLGDMLLHSEAVRDEPGPTLGNVVFAALDKTSGEEVAECIRRWTNGTLTEDGLI